MHQLLLRTQVRFAFTVCVLVGLVAGCAGAQEQAIIRNYFNASRYNDTATIGNIAMVRFDPQVDGIVRTPTVESVEEEQRRPLRVRELAQALSDARAAEEEFTTRKVEYQDEHVDAIGRVLEAESEGREVARRDLEVQEEWTTWRDETRQYARTLSDAQAQLNDESAVAELSVFDPNTPIDLTQYDGELFLKRVTIVATVEMPDEQRDEREMVVTLERVELTGGPDGMSLQGRWIITALE
jgi:hypothetical protein